MTMQMAAAVMIGLGLIGLAVALRHWRRERAAEAAYRAEFAAIMAAQGSVPMADAERTAAMVMRRRAEMLGLGIKKGKS